MRTTARNRPEAPQKLQRGLTLLELMASLSLAVVVGLLAWSMFRQEGNAIRHLLGRSQHHAKANAFTEVLAQGLIQGKGLRELSPTSIQWIDRQGGRRQLGSSWGDSVLRSETHRPLDSICGFQVSAQGKQTLSSAQGFSSVSSDTLDRDDNGTVDWEELDQNHDDLLDTAELPELRLVILTWHACGDTTQHRLVASPRNRVGPPPQNSSLGDDFDF